MTIFNIFTITIFIKILSELIYELFSELQSEPLSEFASVLLSEWLSIFNDIIDKNNKKMKDFINEKIISITINDNVKNSLRDLFTEKYLIYPKFLFYWDSQLLCGTITGGVDKMINFEELKSRNSLSFDKAPENI